MSLSNSSAEPNYLSRLGLHSPPFSILNENTFFFKGEQTEQRLNLLLHLVRSSDKVGVLIGEKGLGKSSVLTQLEQDNSGDDLRIVRVNADEDLDRKALLNYCFQTFGVEELNPNSGDEPALRERFKRLRKLNIRPVLLIDDIDKLSESNMAILMSWLSWQDDEFLLQAILTASSTVTTLNNIHGRLQHVDLPPLTAQELGVYFLQRLEASGYKGTLPFEDKVLKGIYRQSLGNLFTANQLAHQKLSGDKPALMPSMPVDKKMSGLTFRRVGLGIIILFLIILLVFQDTINKVFTNEVSDNDAISDSLVTLKGEELATVVIDDTVKSAEEAER